MKTSNRGVRGVAMLTGVAVATTALMPMQAAHADKEKTYKTGAAVLGALGAVLAVKGKTLPAVIAGAGAYYAYKKGQEVDNDRTAGDVYPDSTRTTRRSESRRSDNRRTQGTRTGDVYTEDVYADDVYAGDVDSDGAYTDTYPAEGSSVEDRSGNDVFYADNYPGDPGYVGLNQKSRNSKSTIALK